MFEYGMNGNRYIKKAIITGIFNILKGDYNLGLNHFC